MSKNTKSVVRTVVQITNADRMVSAIVETVESLVKEYQSDVSKLMKKLAGKSFKSDLVSTLVNVLQDYKDDKGKIHPAIKRVRVADPDAPKKPQSAYFMYANDVRASIKSENPEMKITEISKVIGAQWKELSEKEKSKYEKQAMKAKKAYEATMESYVPPDDETWDELINDKSSRKKSQLKDPDAPKKPPTAYMLFAKEHRPTVKGELESEFEDKKQLNSEVSKALGQRWKQMSDDEKKPYNKLVKKATTVFDNQMKAYTRPSDDEIQAKIDAKKSASKSKSKSTPKDKDAPKKGKTAYNFFCAERRPELKEDKNLDAKEITSTLSEEWKEMSDKQKKKYVKLAAADAERYKEEMEKYTTKKSKSKSKSKSEDDEEEEPVKKASKSKSKSKEVVVSDSDSDSEAEVDDE